MLLKLKDILSNPDRDFVLNPLSEARIAELILSINETGFWDNVLIRFNKEGKPEAAFGHNRIEAAKRVGITEANFIVREWTDEQMLRAMSDENSKEYDYNILALLESVKGVVLGLVSGKVKPFEISEDVRPEYIRYAPSFIPGEHPAAPEAARPYTATAVAEYLKATKSAGKDRAGKANVAITAAINALELLQRGCNADFLYKTNEDGDREPLSAKGLLKATKFMLSQIEARSTKAKAVQIEAAALHDKLAKVDADRRIQEEEEKERQAELRRREAEASREEDEKEAKRIAEQRRREAEAADKRTIAFKLSRDRLDAKVKEAQERQEEAKKQDASLPTRHAVSACLYKLKTITSERNAFREDVKTLSRNNAVTQNERELIRQAMLEVSTWYGEQANFFLPRRVK